MEEQAQRVADQILTSKILPKQLQDMADVVRTDSLPWFRDDDDKRTLRRATNTIHTGAGLILVAYKHLGEVAGELAKDPPDLAKARAYNKQAGDAVALANPKLKSGLKMLRSLQRSL